MTEMISIYKENLYSSISKLSKITENIKNTSTEKSHKYKLEGENVLAEANKILKLIEISPSLIESDNKIILKQLKKEVAEAKKTFDKVVEEHNSNNTKTSEELNYSNDKLIEDENYDEAYKQYNKLENSKRNILGVEKNASEIQRELYKQTETMIKVNNNVGSMNIELDDSSTLIRKMLRREQRNKIILASVIVIFIIIFLIVLFFKINSNNETAPKLNIVKGVGDSNIEKGVEATETNNI